MDVHIGARLPCRSNLDGLYHPAAVQSVSVNANGEKMCSVLFEEDNRLQDISLKDIAQTDRSNSEEAHLKKGQKVYWFNDRGTLCNGTVLKHRESSFCNPLTDCYTILQGGKFPIELQAFLLFLIPPSQNRKRERFRSISTSSSQVAPQFCRRNKNSFEKRNSESIDSNEAAYILSKLSSSSISFDSKDDRMDIEDCGISTSPSIDDGIDINEGLFAFDDEPAVLRKRKLSGTRKMYKCTWPRCSVTCSTNSAIEKHVRTVHLSPKLDSGISDHEEDFYYDEVEVDIDSVADTFAGMNACESFSNDHDYFESKVQFSSFVTKKSGSKDIPANRQIIYKPLLSWPSYSKKHTSAISNVRSEDPPKRARHPSSVGTTQVKKCRKLYGLEQRHLWCSRCKWKKACCRQLEDELSTS